MNIVIGKKYIYASLYDGSTYYLTPTFIDVIGADNELRRLSFTEYDQHKFPVIKYGVYYEPQRDQKENYIQVSNTGVLLETEPKLAVRGLRTAAKDKMGQLVLTLRKPRRDSMNEDKCMTSYRKILRKIKNHNII